MKATAEDFVAIKSIGEIIADSLVAYFADEQLSVEVKKLIEILDFKKIKDSGNAILQDKIFVVTGSLEYYENRKALSGVIESLGAKVTSSVTGKTDYLINNDVASKSSKNMKAKSLDVPIISEADFITMIR
jgi:DNA ligase (NAD+)